jgi:hypothetical protein
MYFGFKETSTIACITQSGKCLLTVFCSYLVVDAVVKGCEGNEAYIFVLRRKTLN